ncbi:MULTISPECIES: DNA-binding transcriptional regulator [Protofrankia]|uniref:helix-turn-helix domain-containing protein n=1 Tax=Protofrankia TaxID=2994361 RepID=UPI00069AD2D1|nr:MULTISPECIES: helix-turn-helix transcriptional regulator [Protofrankia]ONH34149.1 hypothetical protein BL254_17720 [Protofrankia sp. BMG5.30]
MSGDTPVLMLRAYREWYGLEQHEVASRLVTLAHAIDGTHPGVNDEMISRWERGLVRPRRRYRQLLCTLYQATETQLGFCRPLPGETVIHPWPPVPAGDSASADTTMALPWNAEGGLQAARGILDAEGMDRRLFLTAMGTAITEPAHGWLFAPPVDSVTRNSGSRLPATVVDHLDQIIDQLRRMDDQLGGGALLGLVRQHLAYVIGLIEHRRYTDSVGRRLHATAAELLRLAGWLSFDAGQHAPAQRFFVAALHAAHTAGDRALGANILGFASCQAKDLGHVRAAVSLAETALAGYPGGTPRVSAILHLRAAEAYANDQQTTGCRTAIDTAFDRLTDAVPEHGEPGWCYWINEAQVHAQAGYCYLKLHDWPRAQEHLHAALSLQDTAFSREAALRQTLLATAYARQDPPDLDRVTALGNAAVNTLTGEVDSARCIGHMSRLATHLAPHRRTPAVRELLDRADMLTASPSSRSV